MGLQSAAHWQHECAMWGRPQPVARHHSRCIASPADLVTSEDLYPGAPWLHALHGSTPLTAGGPGDPQVTALTVRGAARRSGDVTYRQVARRDVRR